MMFLTDDSTIIAATALVIIGLVLLANEIYFRRYRKHHNLPDHPRSQIGSH